MKYIVLIPARGGSKRLPGKNIKPFCGKPLIYYSIEAAVQAGLSVDTYVSTDDDAIAEIAIKLGAKVLRRPEHLASDTATTSVVLEDAIAQLKSQNIVCDAVITLQATNPVRFKDLLPTAIATFEKHADTIDSLMSVCENKHKLGKIQNNLYVPYSYKLGERSQDIDKLYFENGAVYITKCSTITEKKSVFGDNIFSLVSDHILGLVDIDTQEDFDLGEIIFKSYKDKIIS